MTPRPLRWLGGASAGLLVVTGLLVGVAAGCSVSGRQPRYDSGARPLTETLSHGGKFTDPVHAYVWDVRRHVTSTFAVPSGFGAGDARLLTGTIRIAVPEGCADRTVHWRISADGTHRIGGATTRWLRQYDATRNLRLHDIRPRTLTIESWWNGGDTTCPSFSLTWRDPKLFFEPDGDFLDGGYYP